MGIQPNKEFDYIDAATKQLLYTIPFYDPDLRWVQARDGRCFVVGMYEGRPTQQWLRDNPQPK